MSAFTFTAKRGLLLLGNESGAWMADSVPGSFDSNELLENSDFVADVANWSAAGGASIDWVTGQLEVTNVSAGSTEQAEQSITADVVIGKTYVLEYSARVDTAASVVVLVDTQLATVASSPVVVSSTLVTGAMTFVVPAGMTTLTVRARTTGAGTGYFDYVRVREALPDLSTNDNALTVFGSITKTAVATGADLVAFGGFGFGSNTVTNGAFSTDSDWVKGPGWSIGSGVASCDGSQLDQTFLQQTHSLVVGRRYQYRYNVTAISAGSVRFNIGGSPQPEEIYTGGAGIRTGFFTYGSGSAVQIVGNSLFVGSVDDFSVTEVSSLQLPYTQNIDPSVGLFSCSVWIKSNATIGSTSGYIVDHRTYNALVSSGFSIYHNSNGTISIALYDGLSVSVATTLSPIDVSSGWVMLSVVVSADGTQADWYVNGSLDSTTVVVARNVSNPNAVTLFGDSVTHSSAFNGSMALARIFDGVSLTSSQLRLVYESESHLFISNSFYTRSGEPVSLDIPLRSADRSTRTAKKDNTSVDRTQVESIVTGEDVEWSLSTALMHRTNNTYLRISEFRELMYSTRASEVFTVDIYGTTAAEDEPKTITRMGNSVRESRESVDWISASFMVREQ